MAFSPRAESLLHEAKRISQRLNGSLILIHAGEKSELLENKLNVLLRRVEIEKESIKIVWQQGSTVNVISEVCIQEDVDLLVLGAIQNEDMLRYYMGSVARKISRKPPCSILLVTNPQKKSSELNSIVITGIDHPKTKHTIAKSLEFSQPFSPKKVFIVEEVKPSKLKTKIDDDKTLEKAFKEKELLRKAENKRIENFIRPLKSDFNAEIELKCVFGKEGYSIGHFAEVIRADLLVMNSPDKKLGFLDRFFPHDLEYVLSDMPCDLMIINHK